MGMAVRRLGWIVASSIVVAALQRALHDDGRPVFLLKGGAYLEIRLGLATRATKDVDTLFRGDFDKFIDSLDEALREPWGALELQRTEIEVIEQARRVVSRVHSDQAPDRRSDLAKHRCRGFAR